MSTDRPSSLSHFPPAGDRFAFDADVTAVFDDMLERSIPLYDVMRDAVVRLSVRAMRGQERRCVVDLGASRGEAIARVMAAAGIRDAYGNRHTRYHAVETSEPMLDVLRERFKPRRPDTPPDVEVHELDLRRDYPQLRDVSVTLCVLTLQFTPIEYRQNILSRIYRSTSPGGVILLVEKVLGEGADNDDAMQEVYHDLRARHGYSRESIERKSMALEGVLVPTTAAMNHLWLRGAGFTEIDTFWAWMNFRGWIARRPW